MDLLVYTLFLTPEELKVQHLIQLTVNKLCI